MNPRTLLIEAGLSRWHATDARANAALRNLPETL